MASYSHNLNEQSMASKRSIEQAGVAFLAALNYKKTAELAALYGGDAASSTVKSGAVSWVQKFLEQEGQPTGESGGRYLKISALDSADATPKAISWFEDAWQTTYYSKPASERAGADAKMYFDPDFDVAIGEAIKLLTKNDVYNLRVVEYRGGQPCEDVDISSYVD